MPEKPEQLEYRDPRDDTSPKQIVGQALGGAILTAGLLIGAVAALIYFAFAIDYRGWNVLSGSTGSIIAISAGFVVLGVLLIIAYRQYRIADTCGWAFGIWIGIGVAALVEGVCFMSNR